MYTRKNGHKLQWTYKITKLKNLLNQKQIEKKSILYLKQIFIDKSENINSVLAVLRTSNTEQKRQLQYGYSR
jgi:hypothetical protein